MALISTCHIVLVGGTHTCDPDHGIVCILADGLGLVGGCKDDGASPLCIDTCLQKLKGIDHVTGVHGHLCSNVFTISLCIRVFLDLLTENLCYLC